MFQCAKITSIFLTIIVSTIRVAAVEVPVTTDIESGRRCYINTCLHDFKFLLVSKFRHLVATYYILITIGRVSASIIVWTTIENEWEVSGTTLSIRIRVNRDEVVNIICLNLLGHLHEVTVILLIIRVSIITISKLPSCCGVCNTTVFTPCIIRIIAILHLVWPRTRLCTRIEYGSTHSLELLAEVETLPEVGVRLVETECIRHASSRQVREWNSSHRTVVRTIATVTWVHIDTFACQVSS